ncbi:uncharacterized protein CELE_C10A4.4 [Caenorhabditis elegans]|uniref:Transmembrane protein n=1 Tax=Caenorhabditis elegans TaxID=6239 RepID=Q17890_CAEEL|nr:Transmembrane protein [Caenorhabditis elegans]CCD62396.1 Transmembrane protein [Caenorhabditis elegans]|eukprot:NP_509251.1 Uncharacterized protein CELE_C10A4.4 [Caenorhabditis elegans]
MATPVTYFLFCLSYISTGVKFPETGPNELLLFDSVLAAMIFYICVHLTILGHVGKMIILTFIRVFCFFWLGTSIFIMPEWYSFNGHAFDFVICWFLLAIHITCTAGCITMIFKFFISEQVFESYDWRTIKELFFHKRTRIEPPEYEEAISSTAQPPSYEEAIATNPPAVQIAYANAYFNRSAAEAEDAETLF